MREEGVGGTNNKALPFPSGGGFCLRGAQEPKPHAKPAATFPLSLLSPLSPKCSSLLFISRLSRLILWYLMERHCNQEAQTLWRPSGCYGGAPVDRVPSLLR